MSPSEDPPGAGASAGGGRPPLSGAGPRAPLLGGSPRYGRYVAVVGLVLVAFITLNTLLTHPRGADGIAPGERLPPFAAPLATGSLEGDVNVAVHANEGAHGRRPACSVRGPRILNVCELYEEGPLVLALFVNADSCPAVLDEMQALQSSFPGVRFAAVAIRGDRAGLRRLIAAHGLRFPVGIDRDGILLQEYRVSSCPQLTFAYPGGIAQGHPLLSRPSRAALRARVARLAAGARARARGGAQQ